MEREEALARAAGLDRAWDNHRDDVIEAIRLVATQRASFQRPEDAAEEPAPPYRAPAPVRKVTP